MKIAALELLTDDIDKTTSFYNKELGLKVLERDKSSISFAAGSTKLTFRFSEKENPVYHFAFDIPHNKLHEAFHWIENKVEILEVVPPSKIADFSNWDAESFYFFDDNGNILEFIARYCLDNKSEEPFSGSSIVSVSEIGFVSNDVSQLCDELILKYDIPVFSKQPKLDKFIVMGTDTGLFVLAGNDRNWYPTKKKCEPFWTKVFFENKGKIREFEFSN